MASPPYPSGSVSENNPQSQPPRPPTPGAASSGDETARAVQEVLEDQVERRARQDQARKKPRKRLLPLPVVAVLWGVACLVVWAATPEFLLPEPLPEPAAAELEAGLRIEMLLLVAEINEYREDTGRVPETLERVVEDPPVDVRYAPFPPSSYRLVGERGGAQIAYQSGEPVETLRGNARELIQGMAGGES